MSRAEKLFDAMVKTAMEDAVKQDLASLPSDEELNATYPASDILNEKIRRLIAKGERAKIIRRWTNTFSGIIASLFLLITVGAVALSFTQPVWLSRQDGIVAEDVADFTVMEYAMPAAPAPIMAEEELFTHRALEEVEAELNFDTDDDTSWFYDIYGGFASYSMYISGQEIFVFEMFEEGMHSSLSWHRDGVDFHISGDRTVDELIDIVEQFLD